MWMKSEKSGCLGSWNSQKHRDGHQNRKPWMTISLRIPIRILDAQQLLVGRAFLWLSLSSFLGGSLTGQGRKRLIWNLESFERFCLIFLSLVKGKSHFFLERLDCQRFFPLGSTLVLSTIEIKMVTTDEAYETKKNKNHYIKKSFNKNLGKSYGWDWISLCPIQTLPTQALSSSLFLSFLLRELLFVPLF